MFEDFSFSSPSSTRPTRLTIDSDDRVMVDCDSALISPLSSRCPSPQSSQRMPRAMSRSRSLFFRSPQPPTSVPYPYEPKRLSISTLTKKLHEHTLTNSSGDETPDDMSTASPTTPHSISDVPLGTHKFPGYFLTPPDTDHDDEGYCDSTSIPSPTPSNPQSPLFCPTSVPSDFVSLDGSLEPICYTDQLAVRMQRQRISRLQCNATTGIDSIRRALLAGEEGLDMDPYAEDDCHPSSLPPQLSPRRRAVTINRSRFRPVGAGAGLNEQTAAESRTRRKSVSSALPSHRIDKGYYQLSGRELRKRSEQELRRKSLVSAALASMAEEASVAV